MYNPEQQNFNTKKPKTKKESIRFAVKAKEIRNEREEKIEELTKDILVFLAKNKVDDRDAKIALQKAVKAIAKRCDISM